MATAQTASRSSARANGKDSKAVAARAAKKDLHDAQEAASNLVAAVKSSASNFGEHLNERVKTGVAVTVSKAHNAREKAEDKVRERPLAAIGIAAGIGLLLGVITRR